MHGGPYMGQTQGNYQNDGNQNMRVGQRYQHRGRGGQRGGRGGMKGNYPNRDGNQHHFNKNKMPYNQQYNNNGQMRGGYNQHQQQQQQQQNMPMGMPDQQQQMNQQQQPVQQVMMPNQPQMQMPPQQENMMQLPQVNVAQLDSLQGDDRNNFVGNNIYQTIHATYGEEYAPTITGMLLDETAVDYKLLLTQNQYFQAKAREAYELLIQTKQNQEHQMAMQQQTPQNQ